MNRCIKGEGLVRLLRRPHHKIVRRRGIVRRSTGPARLVSRRRRPPPRCATPIGLPRPTAAAPVETGRGRHAIGRRGPGHVNGRRHAIGRRGRGRDHVIGRLDTGRFRRADAAPNGRGLCRTAVVLAVGETSFNSPPVAVAARSGRRPDFEFSLLPVCRCYGYFCFVFFMREP